MTDTLEQVGFPVNEEGACVALGYAMYGDFITVFCPNYNYNKNKE